MATGTAKVTGTMLVPGVSLNKRLYTREVIGRAVARMKERIADPAGLPISMRTHHDAGDDSLRIVGRVTSVNQDPQTGEARYAAVLTTNTPSGAAVWELIKDRKTPLLDSTSIFGWWVGEMREIDHEGEKVTTADDLEVDAIDFTGSPGVTGARIRTVSTEQRAGTESARGRHIVTETITAPAAVTEGAAAEAGETVHVLTEDGTCCVTCLAETPTVPKSKRGKGLTGKSGVKYADPGYQKDGKQRYELDTPAHIRAAWAYINQSDNQKPYTAQQVAAIKGRIRAAAKKAGIDITSDKETTSRDVLTEDAAVGGVTEWMGPNSCCGFSISAFNGPLTVSVSAYDGIAPGDLPVIAKAAMDAAIQAVKALDPDEDGDFDVPGAPGSDTDNDAGEGDAKTPSDVAADLAGDTVSPDDDMETRTYSVTATTTEGSPLTVTVQGHVPNPRAVADAIARRKARTAETTPAPEGEPDTPAASSSAAPADAPPATTNNDADPAPDSSDKEQENAMSDQTTAPEENANATPPAISEDALKAFAGALGPVISGAVESAVTKALAAKPADTTTETAKPAGEAAPAAQDDSNVTALAEAVKASLDGLPAALAEAIKPLIPAPAAPAADTTATPAAEQAKPAAATEDAKPDPKDVALEAAKLAIPELLEAFGLPRRKGLVATTGEHRGDTPAKTPEELWNARGQVWDQLIPAAPAAVQSVGATQLAGAGTAAA